MSIVNNTLKEHVATILGIPNTNDWEIKDTSADNRLVLAHYKQNLSLEKLIQNRDIRGVVVDPEAKIIVCPGGSYAPSATVETLNVMVDQNDGQEKLVIRDEDGLDHIYPTAQIDLHAGFDGPTVRVFRHDGVTHHSTYRRLDISKSRWVQGRESKTFIEMWKELGGERVDESLFDEYSMYSPNVYTFKIVHPDVLVSSKHDVGPGFLVYMGVEQVWSVENSPYKYEGDDEDLAKRFIDSEIHTPIVLDLMPSDIQNSFVYANPALNYQEANHYLQYGFYDQFDVSALDRRLTTGEFINVSITIPGRTIRVLRVMSPAYSWRTTLINDDSNLLHRLYMLLDDSRMPTTIQKQTVEGQRRLIEFDFLTKYQAKYPLLSRYKYETIVDFLSQDKPLYDRTYLIWPQQILDESNLTTKEGRFYNIWECMICAVPLNRQLEVAKMFEQLHQERIDVTIWLHKINAVDSTEELNLEKRVTQLLTMARNDAKREVNNSNWGKKRLNAQFSMMDIQNRHLTRLVDQEGGNTLYRLVRNMKRNSCPRT